MFLAPGPAHPEPPLTGAEAAIRLRVDPAVVQGWIDAGLPVMPDGRLDPFVIGDWVADHRLSEAPVLVRRWRRFLHWFAPHARQADAGRTVTIRREHRLFLPALPSGATPAVQWHLPRLASWAGQQVLADAIPESRPTLTHHRVEGRDQVLGRARVRLAPVIGTDEDLVPLVAEAIAGFTYTYRRHHPLEGGGPAAMAGSCADLAVLVGERMAERGRSWRLVSGVIATDGLSNPHFWIEVASVGGAWIPVDPTIPCMARRFPGLVEGSADGDWRQWVRAWTGGLDARRVTLLRGESPVPHLPGGATGGSLIGEAVVDGRNAWSCLDWVCGSCDWTFSAEDGSAEA